MNYSYEAVRLFSWGAIVMYTTLFRMSVFNLCDDDDVYTVLLCPVF